MSKVKGPKVKVSIVIPCGHDYDMYLINLIADIMLYTDLSDKEVIIVANGSNPSIQEKVELLGDKFRLLYRSTRIGVASAFSLGCVEAKGEFVVLINDDVRLMPQEKDAWIKVFLDAFKDEKVGMVGKVIKDFATGVDFVVSFCMAIRAKVFEDVGYFDEAFNPYFGEDIDFNIRAVKAGWKNAHALGNLSHKSRTEENPTAKDTKNIAEKVDLLKKRYCTPEENRTAWDLKQAANHVSSKELANALLRVIPDYDLVIDLGCGIGHYCKYLETNGYTVIGVEGTRGINEVSEFKGIIEGDLSKPLVLPKMPKNTTIMSFEVAEHIPKECEDTFLDNLTNGARTIIMSWAVPGQGGDGHVNERPNDYVIKRMREKKFFLNTGKTNLLRKAVEGSSLWWFKNTLMVFDKNIEVTAYVSTKNRYHQTLPLCMTAIAQQTYKPKKLVIYDDGDHKDLREDPLYKNIFGTLNAKGIQWEVKFSGGNGQIVNHQNMLENATTEWLWRLDDDNVPENNALEKLVSVVTDDVGAVAGVTLTPGMADLSNLASSKIEDIFLGANLQWYNFNHGPQEVDHLYSTFLFRKEAGKHGYCLELTKVAHREETIFTYEMRRAGWKLIVNPEAVIWHYRISEGGTASIQEERHKLFAHNETVFRRKLSEWGVQITKHKFFCLDSGIGDHIVFKKVFKKLKKKFEGHKIIIACCYPSLFEDEGVKLISIGEMKSLVGDIDSFNVYKWMWDKNWNRPLEEAFWEMYQ